jgi:hypothetical protein
LPILKYDANHEALVEYKIKTPIEEEKGTPIEEEEGTPMEEEGEPITPS